MNSQLDKLIDLVSPRIGLIRSLELRRRSDDEPRLPIIYDATLANYDFQKGEAAERGACGKGFTVEDAMLGAIGEAIEHYCASHPAIKRMRRAKLSALAGQGIAPTELVLFSKTQYQSKDFRYQPWTEESEIPWVPGCDVATGEPCWIPATMAYLNYGGDQPQDAFCGPSSSGMAAGASLWHAIRSALLELIEREAFMVTWLNRLPASEYDCAHLPEPLRTAWADLESSGIRIRVLLLPTDLPAKVALAVALSDPPNPAAVVGLGCAFRLEVAIRRAIFEIFQIFEPLARKHKAGVAAALNSYSDVRTLEQHAAYFFRPDHFHELEFLWRDGFRCPTQGSDLDVAQGATAEGEVRQLVADIKRAGQRAVFVNLTTPDLSDYPIHVVHAFVTQMQPIHFGFGNERLGGVRLYELPHKLGFTNSPTSEATLNLCPHPLA